MASKTCRRVALTVTMSILVSGARPIGSIAQGSGYYAAGAQRVFQQTDCATGYDPFTCWIAGTHTNVVIKNLTFNLDSSAPNYVYGFGVGHVTTRGAPYEGAQNWATDESGERTINGYTRLTRVCSIDGHVRQSMGDYDGRGRRWAEGGLHRTEEFGFRAFGVGLAMWRQAGCDVANPNCSPEFLRWECMYAT